MNHANTRRIEVTPTRVEVVLTAGIIEAVQQHLAVGSKYLSPVCSITVLKGQFVPSAEPMGRLPEIRTTPNGWKCVR